MDNFILDQCLNLGVFIDACGGLRLNNGYISASGSSTDFVLGRITAVDSIISNCSCGGNVSTFGFILTSCDNLTIRDSNINHVQTAILCYDRENKNCLFDNISFNNIVATQIFLNGTNMSYANLKGYGSVNTQYGTSSDNPSYTFSV